MEAVRKCWPQGCAAAPGICRPGAHCWPNSGRQLSSSAPCSGTLRYHHTHALTMGLDAWGGTHSAFPILQAAVLQQHSARPGLQHATTAATQPWASAVWWDSSSRSQAVPKDTYIYNKKKRQNETHLGESARETSLSLWWAGSMATDSMSGWD